MLTSSVLCSPPEPPFGYDDSQISIFTEVPDFVVPRTLSLPRSMFALFQDQVLTFLGAAQWKSGLPPTIPPSPTTPRSCRCPSISLVRSFLTRFGSPGRGTWTNCCVVARGCDGLIFNLVDALLAAGIVTIPQAGQTEMGGEILMRREAGYGAMRG